MSKTAQDAGKGPRKRRSHARQEPGAPNPVIPVDPERGQGYLNNAEQMFLDLFGDVRKLVNDTGLTGSQRIAAAEVGLSCAHGMQGLKYPPESQRGGDGHDYFNCDDPDCEWCACGSGDE